MMSGIFSQQNIPTFELKKTSSDPSQYFSRHQIMCKLPFPQSDGRKVGSELGKEAGPRETCAKSDFLPPFLQFGFCHNFFLPCFNRRPREKTIVSPAAIERENKISPEACMKMESGAEVCRRLSAMQTFGKLILLYAAVISGDGQWESIGYSH